MKKRREVPTQYPGITRIQVFGVAGKWVEPQKGKSFKARRYEKRPDGTLERIKRSFETLVEARAFMRGVPLEEEVPAPAPISMSLESAETMTLEELVESWKRNWLPTVDLATQLRYRKYLKHFGFLLKMKVAEIQPAHIDAWITHLKTPEYLASCHSTRCSYEHEFKLLRGILNYYSTRCNRNYRLPFLRDHLKTM